MEGNMTQNKGSLTQPMPALIGHRGLPSVAPENTKASIESAAKNKIQWVEIDVTMAGDDSLVIMHDTTLKLFGQPELALKDLDESALKKVDAGAWFGPDFKGEPLLFLDDLLALIQKHQLGLNLEIKINPDIETNKQVVAVFNRLEDFNIPSERLLVSSFIPQALMTLRELSADIAIGVLIEELPDDWLNQVTPIQPVSIHCDQATLTQQQAASVTQHFPLYCFTVNDTETLDKLFSWGVSGVYCDRAHADDMKDVVSRYA
jgi:glycerophosphoryl diester phosphodiesterase